MDLAVVLAVSDYKGKHSRLPGCAKDAEVIEVILRKESRFVDPLVIKGETSSSVVKGKLVDYIAQHKGKEIGEFLFYFSGHGLFKDGEFFYVLSDYDASRTKQTSLENSELDSLIKALKPKITVKIVDACQSGISYVKDDDSFARYLKGSQNEFQTCYFLFSSQSDQSSYQDDNLSDFTKNIATCVHDHTGAAVRYKDLIDYVSDSFAGNPSQTPFFVVQADFTDRFCSVDETLRKSLAGLLAGGATQPLEGETKPARTPRSLKDIVAEEAKKYCTAEEVALILGDLSQDLKVSAGNAPNDFLSLFELEYEVGADYAGLPSLAAIGKWIEKSDHNYFADPVTKTVPVPIGPHNVMDLIVQPWGEPRKENVVQVTVGVKATTDMPYRYLRVIAKPKYPNLNRTACILLPLVSKTQVAIFNTMLNYKEAGWNEEVMEGSPKWNLAERELKDMTGIRAYFVKVLDKYWAFTLDPVRERFGLLEKPSDDSAAKDQGSSSAEPTPAGDGLQPPASGHP